MSHDTHRSLCDAGCDDAFIERFVGYRDAGNQDACLQLLWAHRAELVEAMHEAQRPIDVCDWIIHELESARA